MELMTARLRLRPWRQSDHEPFARLNGDAEVMRYFPAVLTRAESDAMIARAQQRTEEAGFCFQPIEEKVSGRFLGFVGLNRPAYPVPLPFDPCVEIGWRLSRGAWGKGYASEAARAWLRFGFETLGLEEIVSFTFAGNDRSRKVMERLGMTRDPADDFLHPMLAADHPLASHVLYRLSRAAWRGGAFNPDAAR